MAFPVELARASALEVSRLIRDFKENVDSGNPAYLRDGNPESYIGKLNLATERRACRKWASQGIGQNAGTDAVMDGLCKPYLQDIGQYPGEPSATAPFSGGQCDGAKYDVTYEEVYDPSDIRTRTARDVQGPVTGVTCVQGTELIGADPAAQYAGVTSPNIPFTSNRFQFPDGSWLRFVTAGGSACDNVQSRRITGITRTDGSDTCGDPPPEIEPPTPRPDPGPPSPITIAPDFDVDIDVEFFPDGTFNIKFNFGGEGTDPEDDPVVVPVDPSPETREPGGEPGDPVTGTPGSEEEGEAEEGEILVGILVEVDSFPDSANVLFTPSGPVYKGAYYAYLGVEDRLDLQPEGSVARQTQFYFAPPDSTHWRVSANAGYTTTITPYYKPINEA